MSAAALVVVLVFLATFLLWIHKSKHTALLPPGPPPVPIIGNIRDLTPKRLWVVAAEWSKQYGTLFLFSEFLFCFDI
jgi:hypothetical protein